MFRLDSNAFDSVWHHELEDSPFHDLDTTWQHDQLALKPLSDQPFDILHSINHDQQPSIAESVVTTSTTSSSHDQSSLIHEEEEMEYEDTWTTSQNDDTTTMFNTLSWDTHNNHYPSFAQTRLAKKHIGTSFLSEAPTPLFERVIQSRSETVDTVVYESSLVKSLIQAMVGLPSIYFYWYDKKELKLRVPHIRILGVSATAVEPVLQEILTFGTRLKAIELVAITLSSKPAKYGFTGVAMGCCLSELHVHIQHAIMSVFEKEKGTILKVYQYTYHLAQVTDKLYTLTSVNNLVFGVEWMNRLHVEIQKFDLVQTGNDALYRDICLAMLCYTSVPFLNILSKWLGLHNGILDDPYQEFFISVQNNFNRFGIRSNAKLPYFINKEMAIYIYQSGLSLQLLKKTTPNHPIFALSDSLLLKCLLKNMESEEYIAKLETICKYIQTYNSGSMTIEQPLQQPLPLQQQPVDTPMNEDDMIPRLTFLNPNVELKQGDFTSTLNDLIQHDQECTNFIPTLDTITFQSYMKPLQIWCPLLNESFMSSFLHQFKLQSHLSLLYNYFLFGNGTFVNGLKETFFKSGISLSHQKCWPPKVTELNMALLDLLLDQEESDPVTFSIRKSTEASVWLNPQAAEALDFLQLNYHASYPLNIVITPAILSKYNRIFTFLLQILRVHTVTKRMFEPLRNTRWFRPLTRDSIFRYRFLLDQFITTIQGYVHDTAIQSTWSRFMHLVQDMHKPTFSMMEPHTFRDYHEHILDRILCQCFLMSTQSRILQVLTPILADIVIFGVVLDNYTMKDAASEDKLGMKCKKIFDQFQTHVCIFVRVLKVLEEKGSGRLDNILKRDLFFDLYTKYEAKENADVFVKNLLVRLSLNGFYDKE